MASASTIERKWYVVDAADYTLGRLASQVAAVLRGKNKPTYTPFLDCGDNVIVINADKVKVTGKKLDQKVYYSHSDYVGGLKETTLKALQDENFRIIQFAFRPTAENMAKYFYDKMIGRGYRVKQITVYETPNNAASYTQD